MTAIEDYLKLRKVQLRAREEMWHIFSHHESMKEEWDGRGGCFSELKKLIDWEPDE